MWASMKMKCLIVVFVVLFPLAGFSDISGTTEQQLHAEPPEKSLERELNALHEEFEAAQQEPDDGDEDIDDLEDIEAFLKGLDAEMEEVPEISTWEKVCAVYRYATLAGKEAGKSVVDHVSEHKIAYSGFLSTLLLITGIVCYKKKKRKKVSRCDDKKK